MAVARPSLALPRIGYTRHRACRFTRLQCSRSYHSYEHESPQPFAPAESAILSAALSHVPTDGLTTTALINGARDVGYPSASTNLFPRGAFDLVNFHLVTQRLALKNHVPSDLSMSLPRKVKALALHRLYANKPIINRWQEALALMGLPSYIRPSIAELARLSDEIWFLAGDTSVDTSWYTKRATLSVIYSSTEIFMTQDTSPGFSETERFLDRRLKDVGTLGGTVRDVGQWMGFTGHAVINTLRSKGVRI